MPPNSNQFRYFFVFLEFCLNHLNSGAASEPGLQYLNTKGLSGHKGHIYPLAAIGNCMSGRKPNPDVADNIEGWGSHQLFGLSRNRTHLLRMTIFRLSLHLLDQSS